MTSNSGFDLLPLATQKIIDKAFNRYGISQGPSTPQAGSGGGFIPYDPPSSLGSGGGFIIEDEAPNHTQCSHITLENISSALQFLDLPPDDDQVLSVFRNAASGWSSASIESVKQTTGGNLVSLDDWRAVCAVLLEHRQEEYKDDSDDAERELHGVDMEDEGDAESDEYLEGGEDVGSSSGSEYQATAKSTRLKTGSQRERPSSPDSSSKKVTPRQRQSCLEAFSLFFPEVSADDVTKQRIMIKDIQRVSKLIGDQLKAEEIIEMLDAFSSSPDKSVDFEDFVRIMAAAKLV
ncbi:hypothetical protein BDN72DRAFT_823556 [Pluteus cervinus]|uniref:Uncharacterized protein n=1 Tax=Pluteus cervinus TaxID=181527 RepID=A0ACD3AKB8_9AGAR|nr:hypothetical protein BDN72DRAFT_823556 [Pluteus cervinus]